MIDWVAWITNPFLQSAGTAAFGKIMHSQDQLYSHATFSDRMTVKANTSSKLDARKPKLKQKQYQFSTKNSTKQRGSSY